MATFEEQVIERYNPPAAVQKCVFEALRLIGNALDQPADVEAAWQANISQWTGSDPIELVRQLQNVARTPPEVNRPQPNETQQRERALGVAGERWAEKGV